MEFLKGICVTNCQKHSSEKGIIPDSKKLPKKKKKALMLQVKNFNGSQFTWTHLPWLLCVSYSSCPSEPFKKQMHKWESSESPSTTWRLSRGPASYVISNQPLCNTHSSWTVAHTRTQNVCDPAPPKVPVIIILCSQHVLLTMFVHQ